MADTEKKADAEKKAASPKKDKKPGKFSAAVNNSGKFFLDVKDAIKTNVAPRDKTM